MTPQPTGLWDPAAGGLPGRQTIMGVRDGSLQTDLQVSYDIRHGSVGNARSVLMREMKALLGGCARYKVGSRYQGEQT